MYVYVIAYIALLLISFFEFFEDSVNNLYIQRLMLILIMSLLIILSGIRYQVGTDFNSYLTIFRRVESMAGNAPYNYLESGFKLVIIFFRGLNFPPFFLFFVFSVISYAFLGKGIIRTSKLPFLSLFVYFLVFMIGYLFNVLRQGIAMSIFIYLLPDIKEKKLFKVVMFTLIAMSMHNIGIFILIGYFIYHISIKNGVFIGLTLSSIVYYLNSSKFIGFFIFVLPGELQGKMVSYMERFPGSVDLTSYLLRLIIIGLFLFYFEKLEKEDGFKGIFNIYFFGFLFYTLFSFQVQAATRINMFFRILEIVLFPYLIIISNNKVYKTIMFFIIIAIASSIFFKDLTRPANNPFQFFW